MMVRAGIKWGAALVAAGAVLLAGSVGYKLRTMPLLSLVSCAERASLPGLSWSCEWALHTLRPTPEDIREMNRKAGAGWLIDLKKDETEVARLLSRYIAAGLDVNAIDQADGLDTGWTALHLAAGTPDVRGIRLLLSAGADPRLKDRSGRTPLALLREHATKFPGDPRYSEAERVLQATDAQPKAATAVPHGTAEDKTSFVPQRPRG